MEEFIEGCSGVLPGMAAIVLAIMLQAFVLSVLWGWFLTELFHLPVITLMEAMGVSLTARYLLGSGGNPSEDKGFKMWAILFFKPGIILFMGYLIKSNM